MKHYDALVIGGGPAGMTAALYLTRAGRSTALIEQLIPGGQLLSTSALENYPGFPDGIAGWELADKLAAHLNAYEIDRFNGEVKALVPGNPEHGIHMDKEEIKSKTIIICSGAQHRKLDLPDEEKLTGRGVSYCAVCDGNFFKDQVVAAVGGGNSALEEALYLAGLARKVYLIHRRAEFRADKVYIDKILSLSEKIVPITDTVVTGLHGDAGLEKISLRNILSGEESKLNVDGLFVFIGVTPRGDFLPPEIVRDSSGFVCTDTEMKTNVAGIFAAGDIRSKHCRQAISAAGDGATAAHAASTYLGQLHA